MDLFFFESVGDLFSFFIKTPKIKNKIKTILFYTTIKTNSFLLKSFPLMFVEAFFASSQPTLLCLFMLGEIFRLYDNSKQWEINLFM